MAPIFSRSSDDSEADKEALSVVDILLETLIGLKAVKEKDQSLALVPYQPIGKGPVYHETQVKVLTYFLPMKKKYVVLVD